MKLLTESTLKKITKGTAIILLGLFIGKLLSFLNKVIIIRNLTPEEYGLFSLVLIIGSITLIFASLGFYVGIARFIAHFRARKEISKIKGTIVSALQIAAITGSLSLIFIFLTSNLFAELFHNNLLSFPLKIYALTIPFMLFIRTYVSVFRGFGRADVKVIFQDILLNISILLFLIIVFLAGMSLIKIILAYVGATLLVFLIFSLFSVKKYLRFMTKHRHFDMKKTLILFSLPLLITGFLSDIITWADTLMLGYFKDEALVGLYSGILPFVNIIPVFLAALAFIYVPMASQLYARKQIKVMKRNYVVLTKWIFSLTLPISLILFLFPKVILSFFLGESYVGMSTPLRLLVIGFSAHVFFGPNRQTLVALGKTKFIMYATFINAFVNVILNLILIPFWGITGAAIASMISLILANVLVSFKLYLSSKIHPFAKSYLKPVLVSLSAVFIVHQLAIRLLTIKWWMLPPLFISFIMIYGFALLITRSFDKEDIMILLTIEKKFGINLRFIKDILKKFI